jgi:hypothetical protein
MILCVISMFIYVCECIGLRNIVIMMYMYLTMLYPINDLNLNLKKFKHRSKMWGYSNLRLNVYMVLKQGVEFEII